MQNVLTHVRCAIDGDAVGTAEIKNGELSVRLILDLGMIARDALVLNDNVVAELATNVNNGFLDTIDLLSILWQLDSEPCRWDGDAWNGCWRYHWTTAQVRRGRACVRNSRKVL